MRLLMLGLLAWGSASAVTLYTVTVTTAPKFAVNEFTAARIGDDPKKLFSRPVKGKVGTFRVPAGTYYFTASQPDDFLAQYQPGIKTVKVTKNMTITIPVDLNPPMDAGGKAALNSLLIDITGSTMDCGSATVSDICATASLSTQNVLGYVHLHPEFVQLSAWKASGERNENRTATFTIGGRTYLMFIGEFGDAYTSFIELSIQ